jgi:hypothetical protein
MQVVVPSDEPFSQQLQKWLEADGVKTVGSLGEVFAEKSFAVTILFLMFLPALPLPTGGVTHVFEVITVLIAGEMVAGAKRLWIPDRLRRRDLGSSITEKAVPFMMRRIRWFEKHSRPRWSGLVRNPWFHKLLGLVLIGFAISAAVAPPFSGLDTLPSLGAVVVCLGMILEDIIVVGVGVVIGTGGIVLILPVGAALFRVLQHLF